MNRTILAFAAAVVSAAAVQAKTVLWYHFDEEEPGTATTVAQPTILNAVDRTKLAGTPCTMTKGGFDWNKTPTIGTVAGFMPTYVESFNGSSSWFDPVAGVRSDDRTCLNFVRQYRNCTGGANGVGYRSMVTVNDPEDLLKLQTFTVEFFIKFNPENPDPTGTPILEGEASSHIVSMSGDSNRDHAPWMIYAESSGAIDIRVGWNGTRYYSAAYPNGTDKGWANPNWRMNALKDGRWHHVAMTVDGSDSSAVKVSTYVDYVNEKTYTMDAPITYVPGSSMTIGGVTNEMNMASQADIDELRISDSVLTADQFLHPYSVRSGADTAIYLTFDDWFANLNDKAYNIEGSWNRKFSATYLNEAGISGGLYCPIILHNDPNYGLLEFTDGVAAKTRWTIAADPVKDGKACRFAVNETHFLSCALSLPNPCQLEHKGGLTVESFMKMDQPSSSVAATYLLNAYNGGKSWRLALSANSYVLSVCDDWSGVLSTTALSDNAWHHIAVVSDETDNEVRLYVDHQLVGTKTGFTLSHAPYGPGATVKDMRFGDLQDTSGIGAYNGYLDEFRYTLRPLEPQEFLTTRSPATAVLASASFENDLSEGPADLTDLFAEGTLTGTGGYAATRPFKSAENTKSIRLEGGTVNLGRNLLLERKDVFTLEFFLRPETLRGAANLVSLKKPAPSDEDIWSVSLSADKSTLSVGTAEFALPEVADWWHHYGLVFAEEEGLPVVTLYVDHVQVGEPTALAAAFDYSALSRGLVVGSANLTGWIDEIRVTKGALATADMMACGPRLGCLLLLK